MSCIIRRLQLAGADARTAATPELRTVAWSAGSLADAAAHEPSDGVYGVFAAQHTGRVVLLSAHLDRLEDSARRRGIALALSREQIRSALSSVFHLVHDDTGRHAAVRFRVTVERDGRAAMISAEPFAGPPARLRSTGVHCATVYASRRDPHSKTTEWLHTRSRLRSPENAAAAPYELLLVDDAGRVGEGATSNFYIIEVGHRRRLVTAGEGILYGIARRIVLEVAQGFAEVALTAPSLERCYGAREAFLTSATRGIVPVVSIDGRAVGDGAPGPITHALTERYDRRAAELEEPLQP